MPLIRAAALVLALACAAPALAQPGATRDDGLTTVSLAESAQREVPRDRLRITLRVEQAGADAARVQAEINRRMAAALDRAKSVAGDRLRVESGSYHVFQERPQDAATRWRGTQALTLVGADAATLLPLAGQLQQDGFLMNAMSWELSIEARRAIEDALTAEAIERLRARSRLVATAMGAEIVRFDRVAIGAAAERPPIMARGPMPMAAAGAAAPVTGEPGLELVQLAVHAEILVKQRQ